MEFAYVEAFAITQTNPPEVLRALNDDGTFDEHVVRPGVRLTESQAKRLLSLIRDKASYMAGMSACFEPRHAFVFFDEAGLPVAVYTVCFNCHNFDAKPEVPGLPPFDETRSSDMLSAGAFKRLVEMCHELGLGYCPERSAQ